MGDGLFKEGGPHNVRRTGRDTYELSIALPVDSEGLSARECPADACSPGYFKVKGGTGLTGDQTDAYCPYCRHRAAPTAFVTEEQTRFARESAIREAQVGMQQMVTKALGMSPGRPKKMGGGLFSIEMSLEMKPPRPVRRPIEDELRRDLICTGCGLVHAVFGLASYCPDCGEDTFLLHVAAEIDVVRKIVGDVDDRRARLGARVAARDLENALEDLVSVFEAVLKHIVKRVLRASGKTAEEVEEVARSSIRNRFQNIKGGGECFLEHTGIPLFEGHAPDAVRFLQDMFEKRHPITHNLGVVDRTYLRRAASGELEGREVRIEAAEILIAADSTFAILEGAYKRALSA